MNLFFSLSKFIDTFLLDQTFISAYIYKNTIRTGPKKPRFIDKISWLGPLFTADQMDVLGLGQDELY